MADAINVSAKSTAYNRRKRTFKVSRFQIPLSVEVSGAESEEVPDKEIVDDLKQSLKKKVIERNPKKHLNLWQT